MVTYSFGTHLLLEWLLIYVALIYLALWYISIQSIVNSLRSCISAEPVVRREMTHLPEGSVFIYCQVGERALSVFYSAFYGKQCFHKTI